MRIILPLLLLLALAWALLDTLFQGPLWAVATDVELIRSTIESTGVFGWMVYITVVFIEVIFAPLPSIVLYSLGGLLFGGFTGGILTLVGNILGAAVAYWLGGVILHPKRKLFRFEKYLQEWGPLGVFLLRVNPLTSSDFVSYLAGSLKIGFGGFLLGTTLGLMPLIFMQTYVAEIIAANPIMVALLTTISILYVIAIGYFACRRMAG